MRWQKTLIGVFILLAGYGCIHVGRQFDSDNLSWIAKNQTTKIDMSARLGEPFRAGIDQGMLTWTYGYYDYRLIGQTYTKDLVVYFNPDGTVHSYTFSTSFPDEREQWRDR
jgi:hypothetical protein